MAHKLFVNTSKKPIKHPVTGELIPGGHSYTVPDDDELKNQERSKKAWEKAKVKEEADERARAQEEAERRLQEEIEKLARLEAEQKAHEELLANQNNPNASGDVE